MSKSVLFVMNYSVENRSRRKYRDQMNAVKRLGYEVWYIGHDAQTIYLCHEDEKTRIGSVHHAPVRMLEENVLYASIYSALRAALKLKGDFTYCYIRRFFFSASMGKGMKWLRQSGVRVIVEIPTYPHHKEMLQADTLKSRLLVAADEFFARRSAKYIDLFCPMGEQVDTLYGRPALNIENGIDISDIKLRVPVYREKEYHIAALAVMAPWHGYDRLIRGLADYYSPGERDDKIYLHIVGEGAVLGEWRRLTETLELADYVLFEGKMDNEQMNTAFDHYDLGAASLARHRSGMSVVYELKTREYMARGIPFIYEVDDFVIDRFKKYCLKVQKDDSPIPMEQVLDFMKQMRQCATAGIEMREYAAEKMRFEDQFIKIFQALDKDGGI